MIFHGVVFVALAALAHAAPDPCQKAPAAISSSIIACASKKAYCSKVEGHKITYTTTVTKTKKTPNTGVITTTTTVPNVVATAYSSTTTTTTTETSTVTEGSPSTATTFSSSCGGGGAAKLAKRAFPTNPGGCGIKANVKAADIASACECVLKSTTTTTLTQVTGNPSTKIVTSSQASTFTLTDVLTTTVTTLSSITVAPPAQTTCVKTFRLVLQDDIHGNGGAFLQAKEAPPSAPEVGFKKNGDQHFFSDPSYSARIFYVDNNNDLSLRIADRSDMTVWANNETSTDPSDPDANRKIFSLRTSKIRPEGPGLRYLPMPCILGGDNNGDFLQCSVAGEVHPWVTWTFQDGDSFPSTQLLMGEGQTNDPNIDENRNVRVVIEGVDPPAGFPFPPVARRIRRRRG